MVVILNPVHELDHEIYVLVTKTLLCKEYSF